MALPSTGFEILDYSGLAALRAHFPDLDTVYEQYQLLNNELSGIPPATNVTVDGKQGRKPITDDGVVALKKRNDAARLVVEELGKIQRVQSIAVGCVECEGGDGRVQPAIIGTEI